MSSKWWPLISHHVINGSQFIIASSRGPIVTSNFTSRYQGVPFIIASSRGPTSPIASSKGPKFPKYTMRYVLIKKYRISLYLKSYDRDKRVQSLCRGVCGGGVKGIRLWSMGRGPRRVRCPLARTSSLRHWLAGLHTVLSFFIYTVKKYSRFYGKIL